jgi:hypothetical protein
LILNSEIAAYDERVYHHELSSRFGNLQLIDGAQVKVSHPRSSNQSLSTLPCCCCRCPPQPIIQFNLPDFVSRVALPDVKGSFMDAKIEKLCTAFVNKYFTVCPAARAMLLAVTVRRSSQLFDNGKEGREQLYPVYTTQCTSLAPVDLARCLTSALVSLHCSATFSLTCADERFGASSLSLSAQFVHCAHRFSCCM